MLPKRLESLLREAQSLQAKGQLARAAELYTLIRQEAPQAFEGWHFGGMAALLQGQVDVAESFLARACELNPASVQSSLGLGVARVAKGDSSGAEKVLVELVRKQPKLASAWNYLALALETQRRYEEAIAARRRVVALEPHSAAAWSHLAGALASARKFPDALEAFSEALRRNPEDSRTQLSRAMTLFKCHRVAEASADFAAVTNKNPAQFEARSCRLMSLNYLPDISREQVFSEHRAFGQAAGGPVHTQWPNRVDAERRIRVAFLSPDFRDHPVACFVEPLLGHLDPKEFEILLYHDDAKEDGVTARLRTYASIWRTFANRINDTVEPIVRADAPDVLVDLTGHAGTNRLPLLARRLAPVQITYLGYPNTTGVEAIDYRFVDEITDPSPDADRFATEQLVRFAPTAWTYLPPVDAPETSALPCDTHPFVTFGSFNNFPKVTDVVLRLWARVLAACPDSRLVIKSLGMEEPTVAAQAWDRMGAAGLPCDRVEVLPRTPDVRSHLAAYGRIDIALDTFPYHGTTTTCESLWMGVPVVTRSGDRHAARVGASLLTAVGHPEWIALSDDEYVKIAVELANDRPRLAALRAHLRREMSASPLLDHPRQAERFGRAVRSCWRSWCERAKQD